MAHRGWRLTGLIALTATVLAAAALLAAARYRIADPSVPGWLTSPVVSVAMAVSAVLTVLIGHRLSAVADRVLGRWITVLGLSVGLYLVMLCVTAWVAGVRQYPGIVGGLAVAGLGGHVPVLTLLQLTAVQVHDRMTGTQRGRLVRRPVVWIVGLAGVNYLLGFLTFEPPPFGHLAPPGEGTWFDTGSVRVVASVVNEAWLLVMLLGPVMLWRAARRSGGLRRRVGIAGTASLVPVGLIVLCALVGAAAVLGGLDIDVAVVLLLSGMSIAVPLTAAGYALALRPRQAPPVRAWALVGVVAFIFAMLATTASIWLGALLGADAVYAVTAVTVLAMTVLWPAQQRLVQWLLRQVDPRRAVAAALLAAPVAEPGPAAERIVREATGDPAARLTLCLPEDVWLDVIGGDVADPPAGSSPILDAAGNRIGAVTFSVAEAATGSEGVLAEIAGLVEKAVYVAQVHRHATRADRAASEARRRLERDLHDGVQGRLVALALNLRLAQDRVDDPNARLLLDDAVDELRTAVAELRGVSSGVVARRLSEGGLTPALRDLVARLPVPVELAVPEQRFPPEVEAAAYFVTAEAITNAVKHAEPSRITARLQHDSAALTVLVEDDGLGGADPRAGTGLRGIAERVGALGGRCLVSDRTPTGTRVEVAIPCEL